jgi:hypothetical protein
MERVKQAKKVDMSQQNVLETISMTSRATNAAGKLKGLVMVDGVKKRETLEVIIEEMERVIEAWNEALANVKKMLKPDLKLVKGQQAGVRYFPNGKIQANETLSHLPILDE